ncbi:hypothetical protein GCM10027597_04770 [Saccharopolyspora tripterygii]
MDLVMRQHHEHAIRGERSRGLLSQAPARLGVAGFGRHNGDCQIDCPSGTGSVHWPSLVGVDHAVKRR